MYLPNGRMAGQQLDPLVTGRICGMEGVGWSVQTLPLGSTISHRNSVDGIQQTSTRGV